ncbi:MAG: hypothetical protein AMJ79_15235 [Phycisphaerae bacterium SM23_30]|nr:MAG: hypothetical protein AMJ79_15235 [Phycisphaerae bacterium SM23_30]
MKILNLKIEGFRSLKSIDFSPGDLNVLIGPNNGGKSNLLHALEMIAASARGQLAKFVKAHGGMESLVWDGHAESIRFNLETSDTENVKPELNIKFIYELELERIGSTSSYKIEKEILKSTNEGVIIENTNSFIEVSNADKDIDVKKLLNSDKETINSLGIIRSTKYQFHRIPSSWSIFQNLDTSNNSKIRQSFITSFEKKIEPDGNNFIAVLHTYYTEDRDFKNEINQAMKAAFGDDFEELSFAPAADTRSQLRIFWKSLIPDPNCVSFGKA